MTLIYKIDDLLRDANNEPSLVTYMLKLCLLEDGIPVIIDPTDIGNTDIPVERGELTLVITDYFIEIEYNERTERIEFRRRGKRRRR